MMNKVLEQIGKIGIVPVIAIQNAEDAEPLGKALCEGGIPCAEVTFRTEAAEETIRIMAEKCPEMLVGAGTVLTVEQADRAIEAGACFVVSPGLNPKVVKHCVEKGIPIVPGCANPSDIEQAIELGLDTVKFFPAEAAGGIEMIKAMSAPYNKMKFMPTGGIHAGNLNEYLDFPKIIACGGSFMVKSELIEAKKFDEIARLTKEAVRNMLGFSLGHIGINAESKDEAVSAADSFHQLFGFGTKEGTSSIFAGSGLEIMKQPYLGQKGHIAIRTNYIERAVYHMEKQGCEFDKETIKLNAKGQMATIYLKQEIGGFAVHLLQK